MAENKNLQSLIEQLSKQINSSESDIRAAAEKGDIGSVLKNVDSETAQQVESVLSDPKATKKLLESPQAKAILDMLGDKK